MSIAALLQAAEFLERREREAEHGYATTLPMPDDLARRRPKSKKSTQGSSRTTHNELEKNRRAHLRNCLERLKEMVPLGAEASRHTTLGLLTKAKGFIKNLEDRERKILNQKDQLHREQRYLKRRLEQLGSSTTMSSLQKRRSVSECSTSSTSTSSTSTSETDEVDIMGYNSNTRSDTDDDDHSSIQSLSSDGGVAVSTERLTLGAESV